jgi:hypothetical protein
MFRRLASFVFTLVVALAAFALLWNRGSAFHHFSDQAFRSSRHERRGDYGRRSNWKEHEQQYCAQFDVTYTSQYFAHWHRPRAGSCSTQMRNGYPVPDPSCTPGGINPSVTLATLKNPAWRTGCVRNHETSEKTKHKTYRWYGLRDPHNNFGDTQVCELDHLVPLELGGADGLGNIWPECGPSHTVLQDRYFKVKDRVENYLAYEVKAGKMPLAEAQHGIAENWTQYLDAANRYCATIGGCK